jgi:hypothetical protein
MLGATRHMHSAAHETRLLQQVRTRCQRVDVCAPRRIQRADLNCFPAEERVRLDNPNVRPTSLMVVWPRSSLACRPCACARPHIGNRRGHQGRSAR